MSAKSISQGNLAPFSKPVRVSSAFLARMHWDADAVRDDPCAYVVEQHLGD